MNPSFSLAFRRPVLTLLTGVAVVMATPAAMAQVLPGPADADRAVPNLPQIYKIEPAPASLDENPNTSIRYSSPPANAAQIQLKLLDVTVNGVTAYPESEIKELYAKDIGTTVTLARIWEISDEITKKYRQDGYFLSRAFVPAQEIADGRIVIRVAEGYIKQVDIEEESLSSPIVRELTQRLTAERPISSKVLESYHLLLTDLAGMQNYFGTLAPLDHQRDGGVRLIYARNKTPTSSGFVALNNYGSKFLGPLQATAQWQGNLIGVQETFLALRSSLPTDELTVANASQTIPLSPETALTLSAGFTRAEPGFTLSPQEIESRSIDVGLKLNHKLIRQRTENWSVSVAIDGRNSKSTILGSTELSEDKIRALRLGTVYDRFDSLDGYNRISLIGTRGIPALGASDENDLNISRDGAKPDFSKLEIDYMRYQALPYNLAAVLSLRGQKASGSLYSSEEFGFGGQGMGRAYDSSEITGDDGVAVGLELQYNAVPPFHDTTIQPYAFYDIGKVWNANDGQVDAISASSAGFGVRLEHASGITGALELAVPLTKKIDTPIYGGDETSPRIGLQIGYKF